MLQTNNTGMCSQCLSHAGHSPAYGAHRSGSTLLCQEPSEASTRLRAPPLSKLLRLGAQAALRGTDLVGLRFVPFPGPSIPGVWRARSLRLVAFSVSAAQFSGCTADAPCEVDGDCPGPQGVLAKKPACSLVDKVFPALRLPPSSPYGSGCLSLEGDGLQLAISVLPFVLCAVLVVSYVQAFCMVAIPQSGLLAQVSSLWLRVEHSGPILKSTAAHTSLPSPHLLVADAGICAASLLGELLLGS